MDFYLLQNVTDIAGTDSQTLRRYDTVLGGDARVSYSQHQVAFRRQTGMASRGCKRVVPALKIRQKHQHQRRFGDEWLVVACFRQAFLQILIGDLQNGV